MHVRDIRVDCDGDTLLLRVEPAGPACHTGETTCFNRSLRAAGEWPASPASPFALTGRTGDVLDELFAVILDRKLERPPGSYTTLLFDAGDSEILKKVGEEAVEVVLAGTSEGDVRLISELADLVYHLLVLLASRGLTLADLEAELARRRS
jgi:phosphoribosyl-ATP pyrophosphohydrolase/phosphoribosyl-AMP cyclohydrolase